MSRYATLEFVIEIDDEDHDERISDDGVKELLLDMLAGEKDEYLMDMIKIEEAT